MITNDGYLSQKSSDQTHLNSHKKGKPINRSSYKDNSYTIDNYNNTMSNEEYSSNQKSHESRRELSPDNMFDDNTIDINASKHRSNIIQSNNRNSPESIFKNGKRTNSELHSLQNQCTVASKSPKKRFSTQQMLNSLPPDVCLRKLLANQVVMKIELKSINEQLKKITAFKDNCLDIEKEDFSNLDCLFPLESENDLINIENQIQSTPTYRKKLVKELSLSGGSKVKIILARILNKLFKDELLQNYSYFGRNKKKKKFSSLSICSVIHGKYTKFL
ncbi:uncharacterized protein LOC115035108 [Acyrthosiphon pisum]|uniref:DUF4806 domain-containing protein n=1 Tax=Acyrthosiphon pisum TaxID=7029 RepID=A0A8R2NUL7_ACYPI|nr:uncharacterized protein LOC115035108 [Acyrthosiphon pisum]